MNIWKQRNNLKTPSINRERQVQSMLTPPPAPVAVLSRPAAIPAVIPAPVPSEPETPPAAVVPEFISLDQMFEVTDSELHAFSPKNTFTKLKKLRLTAEAATCQDAQQAPVEIAAMNLNALLSLD